jgi:hypothetical protein
MTNARSFIRSAIAPAFLALTLAAQAQETKPPAAFQNLRSEDDAAAREAAFVHQQLDWNDAAELTLGGQVRVRGESWDNFAFGPANDDAFWLSRIRLHTDLRTCAGFRLYVEGISALAHGRDLPPAGGKRPVDEDRLDLLNAFGDFTFDLGGAQHTARLGRQELQYGRQRLVSPLDWVNTRRTFEGGKLISVAGDWRVDTFATRLVNLDRSGFNDGDSGQDFYGVYAATKCDHGGLDFYGLGLQKDAAKFASSSNSLDEDRFTVGARLYGTGPQKALDFDVEGAYQLGDFGDGDIGAYMLAAEVGYKIPDCPAKSRLFASIDYASGDDNLADGDLATFNQLYPLGHAYFGGIDTVGRQNIIDLSLGMKATPLAKLDTKLELHHFQKAEKQDALYDAGGGIVAAGSGSDTDIGQEVDFTVDYALDLHTKLTVGYFHLFAGDAITTGEDISTAFAQAQYTF